MTKVRVMRAVCFCSVCKMMRPYDDVVSPRASSSLKGDICLHCLAQKTDKWIERNIIARHYMWISTEKLNAIRKAQKGEK